MQIFIEVFIADRHCCSRCSGRPWPDPDPVGPRRTPRVCPPPAGVDTHGRRRSRRRK